MKGFSHGVFAIDFHGATDKTKSRFAEKTGRTRFISGQFLQSLCHNSCWSYAVFWKLQHDNQMFLTWEDGCYDHPKLRLSMESILDDMCFDGSNEIFSCSWRSSRHDGHSGEYPVVQAVASMAGVQYRWGEGVVGEVAYTGSHYWVCDNMSAGEFKSKVVPECPDEWLLQFAAGIKAIALVPVVPHGVLQLGTLEEVAEDLALVSYIREKFNAYQNGMDLTPFAGMEFLVQTSSSLVPTFMDNLDESSATTVNQMKSEDPKTVYSIKPTGKKLSTTNQMMPVCLVQDACCISGKDMLNGLNSTRENEIRFHSMCLTKESEPLGQSLNDTESEMIESSMVGFSAPEEELQAFFYSDYYNVGILGEHANVTMSSYFDGGMMEQPFADYDAEDMGHEDLNAFFSFPMDCELHKALGPCFLGQANEYLWDSSLTGEDACNSSSQIFNRDPIHGIGPSTLESSGCFAKGDGAERHLEAVVPSMHNGLNDNLFNKPNDVDVDVKFSLTSSSSGQFAASTKAHSQSEESAFVEEKKVPWRSVTTAFGARGLNAVTKSPPASSSESMLTTLTGEQKPKKGCGYLQTRKGSKPSNASKRRAKPGENQRPRPRDRQLIQDRVKELRELVPNGSKCSIDGLLDKTIKHMMFLRSVTDQADKLRHRVHQKVTGQRKNMKSSGTKRERPNGTSWAFEVGSDLQVCPIVVEDLEYPGHMLIEMLCNDNGLFLEIAEVIRRLDLTILKGVLESHENNTWAHFIVEVSRGFHRLDIFWPLMQLLQRNQSPVSSKI
ncbi:unnamed protein product [Camellia sinensis]